MSRKHFKDFANEIAAIDDRDIANKMAIMVAEVAAKHNDNFNRTRFFIACGI